MSSRLARGLILVLLIVLLVLLVRRAPVISELLRTSPPALAAQGLGPSWEGPALSEERLEIGLVPVVEGLTDLTDVQFPPGRSDVVAVLEKGGTATVVDLGTDARFTMLDLDVRTRSELGLLGLAFHPRFPEDPRVFVNHNPADGELRTTISSFVVDPDTWDAAEQTVLLEFAQPYRNHDGGGLVFGPDGLLYIGTGDGGSGGDPLGHGQDRTTLLGAMLRIDVDARSPGLPYGIPDDNPDLGPDARPELWAIGLRNPWRFGFDPDGRLVVGDVGQNAFEEVDSVAAGDNLGWNLREAGHCFPVGSNCSDEGLVDPIFSYSHDLGRSITGGHVQLSDEVPGLQGRYLVGDFVTGRMWALDLPDSADQLAGVTELGRWRLNISTFGRDAAGRVYVGHYGGTVFRVAPPVAADPVEADPAG